MLRPRFVPLAVLVTLLVAVVALVARGRPLGSGGGRGGLPLSFWDYGYTTGVIVGVPILLAMGLAAMFVRGRSRKRRFTREYVLRSLILFALLLLFEFVVVRHLHLHFHGRLQPQTVPTGPLPVVTSPNGRHAASPRSLHFRWDELAVVLGVLFIVAVVAAIVVAKARSGPESGREIATEVLAAALDDSLDDLRADPDLRRAIIAAYARMETALGAAGIPRSPAEAPLEYVERALLSLDTSAPAVRSLTDLFEWARFSQHEPEPSMRDDAVDALIAVRDELRASELTPA